MCIYRSRFGDEINGTVTPQMGSIDGRIFLGTNMLIHPSATMASSTFM